MPPWPILAALGPAPARGVRTRRQWTRTTAPPARVGAWGARSRRDGDPGHDKARRRPSARLTHYDPPARDHRVDAELAAGAPELGSIPVGTHPIHRDAPQLTPPVYTGGSAAVPGHPQNRRPRGRALRRAWLTAPPALAVTSAGRRPPARGALRSGLSHHDGRRRDRTHCAPPSQGIGTLWTGSRPRPTVRGSSRRRARSATRTSRCMPSRGHRP